MGLLKRQIQRTIFALLILGSPQFLKASVVLPSNCPQAFIGLVVAFSPSHGLKISREKRIVKIKVLEVLKGDVPLRYLLSLPSGLIGRFSQGETYLFSVHKGLLCYVKDI